MDLLPMEKKQSAETLIKNCNPPSNKIYIKRMRKQSFPKKLDKNPSMLNTEHPIFSQQSLRRSQWSLFKMLRKIFLLRKN